jgi:hypothetical protein
LTVSNVPQGWIATGGSTISRRRLAASFPTSVFNDSFASAEATSTESGVAITIALSMPTTAARIPSERM